MTGTTTAAAPAGRPAPARTTGPDPALAPLWRGLVIYRVVALVAAVVNLVRFGGLAAHPSGAVAVVVAMTAWTAYTSRHYLRRARRLTLVDLAVTVVASLSTLVVVGPARIAAGTPVITTIWAAGAVLAVAVAYGARSGAGAGVVSALALVAIRRVADTDLFYDVQLLVVVGLVVGYAADTTRRSARRLQEAVATEAATAERERLARDIHDGVLQVLAYVRRHGADLDLDGAELSRLAGEQETALRHLVRTRPVPPDPADADLGAALGPVLPARASLALPPDAVTVRADVAAALVGIVREAVANTERHAGPDAGLWVLVEDEDDAVTVTVRDDGPGIPGGRLAAAEADGHLGVASSIRGRVRELGGTAELVTGPDAGTEWEVRVPRTPAAGPGR